MPCLRCFLVLWAATLMSVCAKRLTASHPFEGLRNLFSESGLPTNVHYDLSPKKYIQSTTGSEPHVQKKWSDHTGNDVDVRRRCRVVRGTWCGDFLRQERLLPRPVPRGDRDCPRQCSGWGVCHYDTGTCDCPAGRGGPDCGTEVKRPCANGHRDKRFPNNTQPMSSIGPDKLDRNVTEPGWTASRCFGYCYDDLAACFCGQGSYRHIPAPPGSPPWTPPAKWGRPLADGCQPKNDARGRPTFNHAGGATYDSIYGPEGWCNKEDSVQRCGCFLELAEPCDWSQPMESTCVNQCGGHGECFFGFCRCHSGWYGADCTRKRAGLDMEPGLHEAGREEGSLPRPWLRLLVTTPPAALPQPPPAATRPRPLIYVYDIPAEYTSRMLQYRVFADTCVYRRFFDGNITSFTGFTYSIETLLHERMLQSEYRTFDPDEADFFYVPVYTSCYFWPVLGWADTPWWYAPNGLRPMHGANLLTELHGWLTSTLPYWSRRGGRDHVWLMSHDEGACWMPKAVYDTSVVLTHWGRMDPDHKSGTAYMQDVYSNDVDASYNVWPGVDFKDRIRGHPCYDPKKDLVIPAFKPPEHFAASPLLGAAPLERDILLYFRGDVGLHRKERYSRGIRQRLFRLAVEGDWFNRYRVVIGTAEMIPGSYSEHLARSKFCLVAPGDGWSARSEDAVLHGCVPVVIMDAVHAVFESVLDWESFSLRVREDDVSLAALPELLSAVPPTRLAKMQRNIGRVWHRFAYTSGQYLEAAVQTVFDANAQIARDRNLGPPPANSPYKPATSYPYSDDAFHTIMQWLYHRIPDTRGK